MIPLSQSLLLPNYPEHQRGLANGIWGMTAVVGPVAGPILGGWITDNITWSWIFYINLPFGIIAAAITWFNFLRQISLSFGTNLGTTIWDHRATFHDHRLNAEVTLYNPATHDWLNHIQSLGFTAGQANQTLANAIQNQAYVLATNDVAWGSVWIFAILIGVIWLARPAKKGPGHVPAE